MFTAPTKKYNDELFTTTEEKNSFFRNLHNCELCEYKTIWLSQNYNLDMYRISCEHKTTTVTMEAIRNGFNIKK